MITRVTLVLTKGDSVDLMLESGNATLKTVMDNIRGLGLNLTVDNTQEVEFTR